MTRPNLITPRLNPLNIRSIAYAPRSVENPDFKSPTILRRFKLLLMTAFQNGAIMWDQSSRRTSVAPFAFTEYGMLRMIINQNIDRGRESA